ncbi:MAG: hypothetical protein WA060_02250 [Minisyncoccia bacterium]
MQKRNVLNSPRLNELKKRRRKMVLNKILLSLFGIVVVFFFFTYISRAENLNISEIQMVGNEIVDTEEVRVAIWEEITGKYLWLFPKTNILFYPQDFIKDSLLNKFKRIKTVNLSIENNKTLIVTVTERVAKYTWCGDAPLQTDEKCYFLDEDGYIFDEAPYFSGEVYFKFFGHSEPEEDYFFQERFKQLVSFVDTLIKIKLKPTSLYVTPNGDVEVLLSKGNQAKTEPKIIFKLDSDLENIISNLESALNTEPLKSQFKNKYSSLEYIDLRFGNKVYNKFSK